MIYLVLSIICSTIILLVFKFIALRHAHAFPVIVINYTVCVICGIFSVSEYFSLSDFQLNNWLTLALFMGSLFISVFYLMSLSVKYVGVTVTSVANKLSLIIPVTAAYFLYDDTFSIWKIAGIILAIAAIYLVVNRKQDIDGVHNTIWHFLLPVLVLAGSGLIDTLAKYAENNYVPAGEYNYFLITLFGTAACIGWFFLIFQIVQKKVVFDLKTVYSGILLGVPNYGSMYFLIMGLNASGLESSVFFPVNNISIVILSFVFAIIIFKEHYSRMNLFGIALSLIAIICIMMA